jgi:hypothetical protein
MTPIYITCFNSPDLCRAVVVKLFELGHAARHGIIISDQSDNPYTAIYEALACEFGCEYIRHQNTGASGAKRNVLADAAKNGYAVLHQLSEDFIIGENHPSLASGVGTFLEDSERILAALPDLSFVKWNLHTSHNGDMSYMRRHKLWFGGLSLRVIPNVNLLFAVGAVQYSNWPATWKVEEVSAIWDAADKHVFESEEENEKSIQTGGEWAASHCGTGKGAVLIANPMRHPERIKPIGSLR